MGLELVRATAFDPGMLIQAGAGIGVPEHIEGDRTRS
jgi:hypothetical protein